MLLTWAQSCACKRAGLLGNDKMVNYPGKQMVSGHSGSSALRWGEHVCGYRNSFSIDLIQIYSLKGPQLNVFCHNTQRVDVLRTKRWFLIQNRTKVYLPGDGFPESSWIILDSYRSNLTKISTPYPYPRAWILERCRVINKCWAKDALLELNTNEKNPPWHSNHFAVVTENMKLHYHLLRGKLLKTDFLSLKSNLFMWLIHN